MYQDRAHHPLSAPGDAVAAEVHEAMWRLFEQIGRFWGNVADSRPYESRLYSFMANRVALNPLYAQYYATAKTVIDQLVAERGESAAYEYLFTDPSLNESPPASPAALVRQLVSNELIALQLALGGFLAFGATNYPGYFGGANVPGAPAPYRTMEDEHGG